MSVELGERLLPVVKYTITSASFLAKTLSVLTKFVYDHWKSLAILTGYIAALTVVWNAHTIAVKASNAAEKISLALKKGHAIVVTALKQLYLLYTMAVAAATNNQVRLNAAMVVTKRLQMTNIWSALITVVLTAAVAIYGAVKAWNKHTEALKANLQEVKNMRAQQKLQEELNGKVNESIAEQKTKVEQLSRIIHSNAYTIDERRKAIKTLQGIIPEYHASINKEGLLYNENSNAIKKYIKDLNDAALAEAVYVKKIEINKKKLDLNYKKERIKGSLKAVQAYRDSQPQTQTYEMVDENGGTLSFQGKSKSAIESDRQQKIHEQRLTNLESEQKVVEAEDKFLDKVLQKNKKVNELLNKKVTANPQPAAVTESNNIPYVSENEKKKAAAEAKKAEEERMKAVKEEDKKLKAEMQQRLAEEELNYSVGLTKYRDYLENKKQIQLDSIKERKKLFDQESAEYKRLDAQEKMILADGVEEQKRLSIEEMERAHQRKMASIRAQYYNESNNEAYLNEKEMNEALFREDMDYLNKRISKTHEGSLEWIHLQWEMEDMNLKHQEEMQRDHQERLLAIKEKYLDMANEQQLHIALNGLDELYNLGLLKEEEYQRAKMAIRAQYSNSQTPAEQAQKAGGDALKVASDSARESLGNNVHVPFVGAVQQYQATMEQLKQMYQDDEINYETYQAAKRQATVQLCQDLASQFQAAFNSINQIMNAASALYSAQADYETAVVKKKYEKQIAAAGNNQKKVKKLQEKQQKEEAAIKTKYNKKAVKIQIAQAIASTALSAINAYSSAAQVPFIGYILAPIAMAAALAAGMIQIAAIKKQAEAQEAGYYGGGYTGGKQYRKEAGVVHEGEFVANHQAVNNPAVRPMLDFIDKAQRNNTVGSLTAEDVSRNLGGGTAVVTPIVNVTNDNEELKEELKRSREVNEKLTDIIEKDGINVKFPLDSFDKEYVYFKKLNDR